MTRSALNRIPLTLVLTLAATTVSLACGDEAPEPPPEGAGSEAPEGVSGRAPPAVQGVPSVVLLWPDDGGGAQTPTDPAVMDQLGLAFLPTHLIVRPGQTLRFVNSESLAHNVHVSFAQNDSTVFMADMDPDDARDLVLEREGAYAVSCDVHPGMSAIIYVTSAPYAAFAEADGSFVLGDVPPGSYTVEVRSRDPDLAGERAVDIPGPSAELDLTTSP